MVGRLNRLEKIKSRPFERLGSNQVFRLFTTNNPTAKPAPNTIPKRIKSLTAKVRPRTNRDTAQWDNSAMARAVNQGTKAFKTWRAGEGIPHCGPTHREV